MSSAKVAGGRSLLSSALTCPDDDSFAIISLSGPALHHLRALEEDILALLVIVELDTLIWYRHLQQTPNININTPSQGDGRGQANLRHWDGLPSQHGLVDDTGPFHQDDVTLDSVAPVGGQQDVISRNQLSAG